MILSAEDSFYQHSRDSVVGITSGCFDLLHFYHLHYLERCKAQCDFLVVGVDSDDMVRANKGKTPAIPEYHRVQMVAALKCVDAAFIMRGLSQLPKMSATLFAAKVFRNAPTVYGTELVEIPHAEVVIIPDVVEVTSTSALIAKISGDNGPPPPAPRYPDLVTGRDWVRCPVCGEPDMRREFHGDEKDPIINCTNHACASNGGNNASAISSCR